MENEQGATERVVVEVVGDELEAVLPQIPRSETLPPATRLVLRTKSRGWLGKILPRENQSLPPAWATALLARGYVQIEAGSADGKPAVWGESGATRPS